MDKKKQICDLYGIKSSELDLKIASLQNIIDEKDLSIVLDCLLQADLDSNKAVQIYFDRNTDTNPQKSMQQNSMQQNSSITSVSLLKQFQNTLSNFMSNNENNEAHADEKKEEKINVSDHGKCIYCTPLNNHTTLQSLLTNKNIIRGPAGHLSANHDGPWNKFYIQFVENKNVLYESNKDDIIVTIKLLMDNCNEYLCVRFNRKIGTTFKPNIIFAHWKLIPLDEAKNMVAFQSMAFPNMAICIDNNDDFKPALLEFGNNIYTLYSNTMYQFRYIHQKQNIFNQWIVNPTANKMALKFMNNFIAKMNKYHQFGLPNINGMCLTNQQKLHFIEHGWVIIRGAVCEKLTNDAIGYINNGLGNGEHLDKSDINGAWICQQEKILNLYFKSNLYSMVRSILHENPRDINNNYDCIMHAAQVALNFPLNENIKKYWKKDNSIKRNGWHIDGMNVKHDNTQIIGFSLLCGIILSEWKIWGGPFTVFDKSHYNLGNLLKNSGEHEFLAKEGVEQNRSCLNNKIIQIEGNVGDVIIAHPYLAHLRGPNFSNNIRYAVFMRPYVMNHAAYYAELLEKDMFAEYKGLTKLIKEKPKHNNALNTNMMINTKNDGYNTKSIFE